MRVSQVFNEQFKWNIINPLCPAIYFILHLSIYPKGQMIEEWEEMRKRKQERERDRKEGKGNREIERSTRGQDKGMSPELHLGLSCG